MNVPNANACSRRLTRPGELTTCSSVGWFYTSTKSIITKRSPIRGLNSVTFATPGHRGCARFNGVKPRKQRFHPRLGEPSLLGRQGRNRVRILESIEEVVELPSSKRTARLDSRSFPTEMSSYPPVVKNHPQLLDILMSSGDT